VRLLSGVRRGEHFWFFDAECIRIGRRPDNDIVVPEGAVSRLHAELRPAIGGGGYELRDLGSLAGTFLHLEGCLVEQPTANSPSLLLCPGSYEITLGHSGPRCQIGLGMTVPFGNYRLIGRIGGGGMGEVYIANQTGPRGFGRLVAVKLVLPEMYSLVDAKSMFLNEARIAAASEHHNVVKIYDVGEQEGLLFLAMEYVRGVTFWQLQARFAELGERMPPDLVAALLSQACAGLQAVHSMCDPSGRRLNIVHRDVSPSNLMCTSEGLVKVIDFGVARADGRLNDEDRSLQGKPAYMSPEQIRGLPLDGRSDVFAVGVVLYELCSGQHLFHRDDTVATLNAVVHADVPPLRTVCPEASPFLEAVANQALAKTREDRYQSAAHLADALDRVVQEGGGRFTSIGAIARFLSDKCGRLTGFPPRLLDGVPGTIAGARRRMQQQSPQQGSDPLKTARHPASEAQACTTELEQIHISLPLPSPSGSPSYQVATAVALERQPSGCAPNTKSHSAVSRSALRKALSQILRTCTDLDSFCIDHFPSVAQRFTCGMDYVSRINLLFQMSDRCMIVEILRNEFPKEFKKYSSLLRSRRRVSSSLTDQLDLLYLEREKAISANKPTEIFDNEIKSIKRKLRRGPQLQEGEVLGDRYQIWYELGHGGFAKVWLARERSLHTFVAVKVLHSEWGRRSTQWDRFQSGARNMARLALQHPGFVRVLSDGLAHECGFYYFVMEYMQGGDLRKAILSKRINPAQGMRVILQAGAALHFAHEQGLIHRDVKPHNILLDSDGSARLGDFDLALAPDSTHGTRTGALGTFVYAAPEALEDARYVDRRADVFSLGMTATFVLFAYKHNKDLPARAWQNTAGFINQLDCSSGMRTVLRRATSLEPEGRYLTVSAFCAALSAMLHGEAINSTIFTG